MNRLNREKRVLILKMITEGGSIRGAARITGVSQNTVSKLVCEAGEACADYQDRHIVNLPSKELQLDEIWSFVGCRDAHKKKAKDNHPGDVWVWIGIDPVTKIVPTWTVGDRSARTAAMFCRDLGKRFSNRLQITSDGYHPYKSSIAAAFDPDNVDYAHLVKSYEEGKYGHEIVIGVSKKVIYGSPKSEKISTSMIERQNLTLRMSCRRFSRFTNAHSKKIENHCHALALHFHVYNFLRVHQTLKTTPAVAVGIADKPWTMEELVDMIDRYRAFHHPPKRPLKYRPRKPLPKVYERREPKVPWYLDPESGGPPAG